MAFSEVKFRKAHVMRVNALGKHAWPEVDLAAHPAVSESPCISTQCRFWGERERERGAGLQCITLLPEIGCLSRTVFD